jgi:uncharacterized protein YrrD
MQFAEGAKVFTADGEKVGTIDRVVLEPDTKEVTHLVIKKGFLLTEDKVVPMSLVGPATEDRVTLREDAGDLEKLPDFQETNYVAVEPVGPRLDPQPAPGSPRWARPLYFYPPLGSWWTTAGFADHAKPRYVARTEKHIPEGTVALEEGAKVIGSDGEHIGDIERVFTDPLVDRATHLLISEGLFLKEKKLIPTKWITNILEDAVHLSVDSDFVESLPEYQPQG